MGVGGGARDSDRDGRFLGPSSSFLSLLPRTLRSSSAVAPASEEEEIELVKKFFKYEELMDSTKLVESAKRVLSISSELSDVDNRKPFEDKGRMSTLDGQDGAMTRRQGLGRKKAQFTFRPSMSDSLPEKGPTLNTEQLHNPEDFFLAFERHENAERELRKLKGETPLDTTKPSLSEVARPRRPGLLGRRASFKHVYQAPVDNAEVLESLQENVLEMAVSPANTPTTAQRTQRPGPLQPMGTNNTQVRNVSHGKGSIAETEKRINHHLDILMSSCKDMGEQETLVYLRERLQIKPIEIEKLDLSDLDIVRRDAQRDLLQQLPRPRKVSTNFQGGTYAAVVDEGKDAETGELGTFGSLQKSQSPPRNLLTSVEKSEKHFSHDLLQGLSSILRNNGASTSDHHLSSAEPERAFPPPVNGGIGMKSTNNSDKFTFIRSENGVSFDAEVQSTVDTEGIIGSNINPVEMLRNDLPFSYEIDEFVDRLIVDMEVRAMDLDEGSQDKADYIPSERVMDLDGVSEHKADNISKETRAMDLDVGSQDKADDIPSERVMDFDGVSEQKADDNSKETRAMDLDVGSQDKADEIPSERVMNFDGVSEQKADDILKETRAMDLDVGSQDKADDITREASASREQQVGSGVLLSRTWDHSGTEEPPFHLDQNTNKIHMDAVVHPAELDHNLANEFTVRSVPPDASVSQGEELVDQTVATREGNTKKRKGVGRGKRHALKAGQSVLSGDHDHTESSSILSDQSNKENHAPSKASPSKCKNQNTSPHRQARKKRDVPRHSLAGAGTKIEFGLRRSTRIKLKPLEYWRGERLLYGRIHDSLATVIGVQYFSPGPDKKKSVLKVKSYVSEEYTDLLERAASH